jgi:hypothetical protein
MRYATKIFFLSLSITASPPSFSDEAIDAKSLHDKSCLSCHDTDIYTREDRKIHTKKELAKRVKICDSVSKSHWKENEINAVTEHLNTNYYKFEL